jgi:hypothetical protein
MKGYLVRLRAERLAWFLAVLLPLAAPPAGAQSPPAGAQSPPAAAQSPPAAAPTGLELTAPPAAPRGPEFRIEPTMPLEQQGAREQEFFHERVLSRHEPAFIQPFVADAPSSRTTRVRVGLSGWTAPRVPYDSLDATGGLAFGLTILWGAPAAPPPPPAALAPSTGER